MAKRLYLTTECVKLTIGFFGGIGGLILRVFMTHSKLSKVWEREVKLKLIVGYSYEATKFERWEILDRYLPRKSGLLPKSGQK